MLRNMEKMDVISLYRQGTSLHEISRRTGFARNTVRSYVREYQEKEKQLNMETNLTKIALIQEELCSAPKRKKAEIRKKKFNQQVEKRFLEIISISELKDKELGINKQTLTATKIHRILTNEGYDIGLSTIAKEYRKYKDKCKECYIRQEYEYGYRAEYDFHQVKLIVNGEKKTYHQVTIVAPRSDYVFERLYSRETKDVVIKSLIEFFNESGGVFREIAFDNMTAVVRRDRQTYTEEMVKLSTYYGFRIFTCNVRAGNEKGSVENGGKYTRNDIFSIRYKFTSEEELFEYHSNELSKINNKYKLEWGKEKKALMPLPSKEYIIQRMENCTVNTYSCICVGNNFYSVPDKYVGQKVQVNEFYDNIVIYIDGLKIAEHKKIKGFHEYKIEFDHYLKTFSRKPAALEHSVALKQAPEDIRQIFYTKYSTNPKKFIEDYINYFQNNKGTSETIENMDSITISQLTKISEMFGVK